MLRGLFIVGLIAWAATWAPAQTAEQAAVVRVGLVKTEEVRQRRSVTGAIEPARRSAVAAEEAGRVVVAPPEPGVPVTKGQVLARIDDVILQAQRLAAEASVAEAEARIKESTARLEISDRNTQRLSELRSRGAAEENEVADARSNADADRARLDLTSAQLRGAQAQLRLTQLRLEKSQVVAPFDGFVVAKATEVGRWVEVGDTVSEVVEVSRVKVRLQAPQELLPHISDKEPISIHIDALDTLREAPLFSVIPDADPQARTFGLLIKLDNPEGQLKPGMSVSASLPTGKVETALTVPRNAVQSTPSGTVVYALRGGVAALVPVTVRFGTGDRFVVTGDLRDAEQVVVEGNERLRPGTPLKVVGQND